MELRHLRYYREVCRTLSFSRAAENLHIAQPPLSRQIQQLESELMVRLIHRTRPLELTDAGEYLYQQTNALFAHLEEIVTQTQAIAHQQRPRFVIGYAPSMLYGPLPELLRLLQSDPELDIEMQEMVTRPQIEALKKGQIDIGFGRIAFHDSQIEQFTVCEEPLVAVLACENPLNTHPIELTHISQQPLILYPTLPRPGYADHIIGLFERRSLGITISHQANDMQTTIALVAAGMGVTLVPESARQIHHRGVRYVDIHDPDATSPVILSWRKDEDNPLVQRCKTLLRAAES